MLGLLMPVYMRPMGACVESLKRCHFDKMITLKGCADISVVRHKLFMEALKTDCDEFLCVDADIWGFTQGAIIELQSKCKSFGLSIIGGDYPFKKESNSVHHISPWSGLQEVKSMALGFCLIKRSILEACHTNFFPRCYQGDDLLPETASFSIRLRQLGFSLYIDSDMQLKHGEPLTC